MLPLTCCGCHITELRINIQVLSNLRASSHSQNTAAAHQPGPVRLQHFTNLLGQSKPWQAAIGLLRVVSPFHHVDHDSNTTIQADSRTYTLPRRVIAHLSNSGNQSGRPVPLSAIMSHKSPRFTSPPTRLPRRIRSATQEKEQSM